MSVFRTALLSAVADGGGRPAVIEDDVTRSYADLDRWSSVLARSLAPSPARPPVRPARDERQCAALLLPNGAPWLAAYLAVLKADMVAAPLNPALTGAEISRVLEHTRPRLVLCSPEREPEVRELVAGLSPAPPRVRTIGPVPPDADAAPDAPAVDASWQCVDRGPRTPCLVMHTSGTTGSPKALVQTEQALHLTTGYWRDLHRTANDVVALPIPLAHTYGHLVAAATLLAGAALIAVPEAFDPRRWAARLTRRRATVLEGVPALYARLLTADAPAVSGGRLRRCLSAGQQAPADLRRSWERRTGVPLLESWGMTELAGPGLGPFPGTCRGSAGVPVPGLRTRLVAVGRDGTTTDGAIAEPGTAGELWVRGPQVTPGHRTDAGGVVPVCDEQGWLRTGDLAVRDEHGCVTLTGRIKDVIITRGYNVHPAEVEAALREHPGVADVAVVGRADPERGEEVPHAVVVAAPGSPAVSVGELREHCLSRLARYKVPRTMEFVRRLPVSATGKLDRAALRGPVATTTVVKEG
ncbi:class I adenylate-forming enzyme family protein [Streptomyces sp. NPDC057307]|uniref:class I adenylate-forming enzyme family protein n=1 Tax=Streptomyces sp. NPDC057307 TaxID=3346096 RepID=UPI003628B199